MRRFELIVALCLFLLGACSPQGTPGPPPDIETADTVLVSGRVYTGNEDLEWAEAVAIRDGRILFVGATKVVQQYVDETTRVVDLQGRMAMPGLVDAHVHPVLGGMEVATQCLFPTTATPEEVELTLKACIVQNPEATWLVGGRWESAFFGKYGIDRPAAWLDRIANDRGISLADDTGHNRWVNSLALEWLGYDADTDIPGGEIILSQDGAPNGVLLESAIYPVLARIEKDLNRGPEEYAQAARISLSQGSAFGFTGIKEAGDADSGIIAYKTLDLAGELKVHLTACIAVTLAEDGSPDLDRLQRMRDANRGQNLQVDCAKLFLDGVPSEARTAAMIEDYVPTADGESHNGQLLVTPNWLRETVAQLDALGFTVKAHVAGDRAVREFLDAVEFARKQNGKTGLRHELAHSGLIDPVDLPRFKSLNVVADMSPSIWYPSPVIESISTALGEDRANRYFAFRDVLDAGAEVVAGSDWPAVVPDMTPWTGIEAMITRRHPQGEFPGTFAPDQAISLAEAIRINTLNGARALGREAVTGTLEVGKWADIIVLNHNLFEIPTEHISDTEVAMTWFKGELVYQVQ